MARVPYLYQKIINDLQGKELRIDDFKMEIIKVRIPKKEYKKLLRDLVDMGLIERKGRKIRIL